MYSITWILERERDERESERARDRNEQMITVKCGDQDRSGTETRECGIYEYIYNINSLYNTLPTIR